MRTSLIARCIATVVATAALAWPGVSQAATREYVYVHELEPLGYSGPNNPLDREVSTPLGRVQAKWWEVVVTPSGSELRVTIDDFGAADGQTVPVWVRQPGFEFKGCVPVRTVQTFTGLTPDALSISIGAYDQGSAVLNLEVATRCSAPATAGTLTVDGVS
jgi:hypothetical protein